MVEWKIDKRDKSGAKKKVRMCRWVVARGASELLGRRTSANFFYVFFLKFGPPECRCSQTLHSWVALNARREDARTLEKPQNIYFLKSFKPVPIILALP